VNGKARFTLGTPSAGDGAAATTWSPAAGALPATTTMPKTPDPAWDELSDQALIGLIRQGRMEAWDHLMLRHAAKAYQIAYGILGSREDAEEVAQDGFVRIYRALDRFRGDSEFSTWMYRIIVNQARNRYRWNKRRGALRNVSIEASQDPDNEGIAPIDLADPQKTPDQRIVYREWEGEIAREMQHLPPVNREALFLRNVKNMSYEQIADVLDCKVGTVKSRIARAREELRKRLGL
jgi:RNA polymerase sigma-70 factor (ECF subfamily)